LGQVADLIHESKGSIDLREWSSRLSAFVDAFIRNRATRARKPNSKHTWRSVAAELGTALSFSNFNEESWADYFRADYFSSGKYRNAGRAKKAPIWRADKDIAGGTWHDPEDARASPWSKAAKRAGLG
jgi:hypothetical protein